MLVHMFKKWSVLLIIVFAIGAVSIQGVQPLRTVKLNIQNFAAAKLNANNAGIYVVIDKSDYELSVFDSTGWLLSMPVVFGVKDQGDKMYEGDRKTPNGVFKIIQKRNHNQWKKFMLLDYPTKADVAKFNERKKQGLIPKNAKIGNGIGIHGCKKGEDFAVDTYKNWTNGCISLKTADIYDLFEMLPLQTVVTIQP
jgi:murein L,D-transpeptidase YafK